jgi:hypothetical protein
LPEKHIYRHETPKTERLYHPISVAWFLALSYSQILNQNTNYYSKMPAIFGSSPEPSSSSCSSERSSSTISLQAAHGSQEQLLYRAPSHEQHQEQSHEHHSNDAEMFLKDFSLLAEAAKRAQMACLMRDLEGIGL